MVASSCTRGCTHKEGTSKGAPFLVKAPTCISQGHTSSLAAKNKKHREHFRAPRSGVEQAAVLRKT
eukprot:622825-Amphidinium_carterae.1